MPVSQKLRQFAITVKAVFTGQTKPSKIILFQTKISHRKLHIPPRQEQEMVERYKERFTTDMLVD